MNHGVRFADIRQELVAEALSPLKRRAQGPRYRETRPLPGSPFAPCSFSRARAGARQHRNDADIRLNCCKRVVCGRAASCAVSALNRVDFPTFGSPTIPACSICGPQNPYRNNKTLILHPGADLRNAQQRSFGEVRFELCFGLPVGYLDKDPAWRDLALPAAQTICCSNRNFCPARKSR